MTQFGKIIFITFFLLSVFISPMQASEINETIQPLASVVPCDNDFNVLIQTQDNVTSVYKRLPPFATPGSTLTVTQNYATTISNSATFNLIPEFLAGVEIGWSKTNNTQNIFQLAILDVHDIFRVFMFKLQSPGYCELKQTTSLTVYEGWAFDLIQ